MNVNIPGGANAQAQLAKKAGTLPAGAAYGFAIVAAVLGTGIDFVFIKLELSGYLWWAASAAVFAIAGMGAGMVSKASKAQAMTAMVIGAVLYGALSFGLIKAMWPGDLGIVDAIIICGENLGIGLGVGMVTAQRAATMRDKALQTPG